MNCACGKDENGNVTGGCGAHSEWLRKALVGLCGKEEHKNHEQLFLDLIYQRRRADFLERLLIEGGSHEKR